VVIRGSSWLAFDTTMMTSSFGRSYSHVWHLQHIVLMAKDCKLVCFGGFLQPMFFQWVLDPLLTASGFCGLQSLVWRGCLQVSLSFAIFSVRSSIFDWQYTIKGKKMTILIFNVLLFFRGYFVSWSFVQAIIFVNIYIRYETLSWVSFSKKIVWMARLDVLKTWNGGALWTLYILFE